MARGIVITERQLQEWVRKAALTNKWKIYHVWSSMHSAKGWPDCVLVKDSRLIFAELKSDNGKVSADQQEWLDALQEAGQIVFVWRPSDMNTIWEILSK